MKNQCPLCRDGRKFIDWKDLALLRRYVSAQGKIRARKRTNVCNWHQRKVAQAIKYARNMALLPYTTQVRR